MAGKFVTRFRRSLLAALAAGTVLTGGVLGATSASAVSTATAGVTAGAVTGAAPSGASAVSQQQGNLIKPSYYVSTSGQRLSAAQVSAGSAAAAAALPVYVLAAGQKGYLDDSHECRNIGSHGGASAIECADVYAKGLSAKQVNVYAGGEGNCQVTGGYTRCPAVKFVAQLANAPVPGAAYTTTIGTAYCGGDSPPLCNEDNRNYFIETNDWFTVSGCNINPGAGYEFWTEVQEETIIALPGPVNAQAPNNFGSAHVIVCSQTS
jgi:hypothetical protein